MSALFSFEWLKLSKRWMPRVILLLLCGLMILVFWGQASRGRETTNLLLPRGWLAALVFSSFFAPFFWPVLGGSWAGNEYGWGTIRSILTRRPARMSQALMALAALCVAVLIGLLAILVVATLASLVVAQFTSHSTWTSGVFDRSFMVTAVKGLLTAWYVSSFYLVLAYCAAVVTRSAAVGIAFGIGSTLAEIVVTGIFSALGGVWTSIADHFPFLYSRDMVTTVVNSHLIAGTNLASVERNTPSAGQSLIALAIYGGVLIALMLVMVHRRDVTA